MADQLDIGAALARPDLTPARDPWSLDPDRTTRHYAPPLFNPAPAPLAGQLHITTERTQS